MTDPRETLARIRKQANAATEGPWEVGDRYHCQAADMCDCAPDRGPLIDTYQHPEWGTMHVHRKDEPWWNEGVLFRKAGGPPGEVACDLAAEDAEFIASARTTVPALLDLADAVLERHVKAQPITAAYGTQEGGDYCAACAEDWPCPDYTAATTPLEVALPPLTTNPNQEEDHA